MRDAWTHMDGFRVNVPEAATLTIDRPRCEKCGAFLRDGNDSGLCDPCRPVFEIPEWALALAESTDSTGMKALGTILRSQLHMGPNDAITIETKLEAATNLIKNRCGSIRDCADALGVTTKHLRWWLANGLNRDTDEDQTIREMLNLLMGGR